MLKKIGAVIVGFLVASAVMMVFEFTNSKIFTFPANLDRSDLNAVREFARTLPQSAFLMVLGGWAAGSFLAGLVVRKIAGESGFILPAILSVLLLIGGIVNFMFLPHPIWVVVLGVLIFLALPLAGFKFGTKLLRDHSLSIAEFSNRVGFTDQSYFDKRFKEYFGKSPRECRENG